MWGVRPPSIDGPRARDLSTPDPVPAPAFASQSDHIALIEVKGAGDMCTVVSELGLALWKQVTRSHGALEEFLGVGIG